MEERYGRRCLRCGFQDFYPNRKAIPLGERCPKCDFSLVGICGAPRRKCWGSTCEHDWRNGFPNGCDICPICEAPRCRHKFEDGEEKCPHCGKARWCGAPSKVGRACHRHGGKNPGTPSARKYAGIPRQIVNKFKQMQSDPERLSTLFDISLFVTRQEQLLGELYGNGADGSLWAMLNKQATELSELLAKIDDADVVEANRLAEQRDKAIKKLLKLVGKGATEERKWKEILDVSKDAARLKAEETKRIKEMQATITVEDLLRFAVRFQEIVKQHVKDSETRHKIGIDIERVVNLPPLPPQG